MHPSTRSDAKSKQPSRRRRRWKSEKQVVSQLVGGSFCPLPPPSPNVGRGLCQKFCAKVFARPYKCCNNFHSKSSSRVGRSNPSNLPVRVPPMEDVNCIAGRDRESCCRNVQHTASMTSPLSAISFTAGGPFPFSSAYSSRDAARHRYSEKHGKLRHCALGSFCQRTGRRS